MNRRDRRRAVMNERNELDSQMVNWIQLPDDYVIQLFSCLNIRDRASLSSTCKSWRRIGASSCLWQSLDLRAHKCDWNTSSLLAPRCLSLQKLQFHGAESADPIINLCAIGLRELSIDYCKNFTDSTLSVIAARHECLETLQLENFICQRITSDAIKAVALCCPNLAKLRLSGIREVNGNAINALANHCPKLTEIGFTDCLNIDEIALGNVISVRFLSVAGTTNVNWGSATNNWSNLESLKGLDVSRTVVAPSVIITFLSSLKSLKVLCALDCPLLEGTGYISERNYKGKLLLAFFTDIFKRIATLFGDSTTIKKDRDVFLDWRKWLRNNDRTVDEIVTWLEWILSHSLFRIAESNPGGYNHFWVSQGADLLLSLVQSSQEDVQERAATGLATFLVVNDENATINEGRAKAVMKDGGIRLLLNLTRSLREGIQSEATKAIAKLSMNTSVAKAVAEDGGITVLANLTRSMNRLVAEEAAAGLMNLAVGEEHMAAIFEAGGIKALVDLITKWSNDSDRVLERAAGALANLVTHDKYSMEVANIGGVHALVILACNCKHEGVQEQAARALANLTARGDNNSNQAVIGQEPGAFEALIQLTRSRNDGISRCVVESVT